MGLRSAVLMLWLVSGLAWAQTTIKHLSVNEVYSGPEQPLRLTMNIVGQPFVVQQLRFFLQQPDGRRWLLKRRDINDYLVELTSNEPVAGTHATILVTSLFRDSANKVLQFSVALNPNAAAPEVKKQTQQIGVNLTQPAERRVKVAMCDLKGQSLWAKSKEWAPQFGLGHFGSLMALHEANPECFEGGNPNHLICKQLQCPSAAILSRYQDEVDAKWRFDAAVLSADLRVEQGLVAPPKSQAQTIPTKPQPKPVAKVAVKPTPKAVVKPKPVARPKPKPVATPTPVTKVAAPASGSSSIKPGALMPLGGQSFWSFSKASSSKFGLGQYGSMMALLTSNPGCFTSGNPNRLICEVLRAPSTAAISQWRDEVAAKARFRSLTK